MSVWKFMINASTQNIPSSCDRFSLLVSSFPQMSYFLLKNVHCCLPWNRWEWCGRHLMRAGPPGAWPPQALALSVRIPEPVGHTVPSMTIPYSFCQSWQPLHFVFSSEPPRRPRIGLEQRPQAHVSAVTWPATLPDTCHTSALAHCGPLMSSSSGTPGITPKQVAGMATYPQCQCWVEITPSCMSKIGLILQAHHKNL